MSPGIYDGASNSLTRQLKMIRHIHKHNNKGLTFTEIDFHMTAIQGMSTAWTQKYLKKWSEFKVVYQKGTKFYVNEEKWVMVQRIRDEDATSLEG